MTHFSSKPNLTQVSGFYNLLHLRFWKKQFHFGYHHHFIILQSDDGETSFLVSCSKSYGITSIILSPLRLEPCHSFIQTQGFPTDPLMFVRKLVFFATFCNKIMLVCMHAMAKWRKQTTKPCSVSDHWYLTSTIHPVARSQGWTFCIYHTHHWSCDLLSYIDILEIQLHY